MNYIFTTLKQDLKNDVNYVLNIVEATEGLSLESLVQRKRASPNSDAKRSKWGTFCLDILRSLRTHTHTHTQTTHKHIRYDQIKHQRYCSKYNMLSSIQSETRYTCGWNKKWTSSDVEILGIRLEQHDGTKELVSCLSHEAVQS